MNETIEVSQEQSKGVPLIIPPVVQVKSIVKKGMIIFSGFLILLIVTLLLLFFTRLDTKIFPLTISGVVRDSISLEGINEAEIIVSGEKAVSSLNGSFAITGYFNDQIEVIVTAENYNEVKESITLNRNFLSFNYIAEFKLKPNESGILKGKIVTDSPHNFSDDKIFIDLVEIPINEDGTFTATNLQKGDLLFEFQSLTLKDIEREITIDEGENTLEEITTVATGDILGTFFDWVNEAAPVKAQIQADNVLEDQISVQDDGIFKVKDLEVGKEYTLRISHPNYLTRDYKITIKQGANQLFDLRMIPDDIYPAYTKRGSNRQRQIFRSDLDGSNETQLTNIDSFDPSGFYYDNFKIYFRDDYERLRGANSSSLVLGYSLDLLENIQSRVTSNIQPLQNIYYFYNSQKLVNILVTRSGQTNQSKMELRDLDGNNPVEIVSGTNLNFTNLLVSNNGIVFYTVRKSNTEVEDLFIWSAENPTPEILLTEEDVTLYDISPNGNRVLLTRKNSNTGFEDLISFDVDSRSTKILLQNHDGNNYRFEQDTSDLFYFYANRDGRNNIFRYDLTSNKTTRITFLNPDEDLSNFYIVDRYLFYIVGTKLYVLDKNQPVSYKLVTSNLDLD